MEFGDVPRIRTVLKQIVGEWGGGDGGWGVDDIREDMVTMESSCDRMLE